MERIRGRDLECQGMGRAQLAMPVSGSRRDWLCLNSRNGERLGDCRRASTNDPLQSIYKRKKAIFWEGRASVNKNLSKWRVRQQPIKTERGEAEHERKKGNQRERSLVREARSSGGRGSTVSKGS